MTSKLSSATKKSADKDSGMARKGGFIGQDGLNAPDEATDVSASAGDEQVDVSFTSPADVGGADITEYRVTDSTGAHGATGASSPITVSGLTNGTSYTFNVWAINPFGWSSPSAASADVSPQAPTALFAGGASPDDTNVIQYVSIATTGNAADFGDLTQARQQPTGAASSSRGVFASGYAGASVNTIDFVTFGSLGNAVDFGDLINNNRNTAGGGNSTRGVFGGGRADESMIQYITFASAGNASDFGDMSESRYNAGGCSSPTRTLFGGGFRGATGGATSNIEYITTASTGNGTSFGSLTVERSAVGACSSSTRGVFAGGAGDAGTSFANYKTIDYVTIASTGSATDFGDLSSNRYSVAGASSETRGLFAGGVGSTNIIEYITIASTGDATDFGDLLAANQSPAGCSSAHGGLS